MAPSFQRRPLRSARGLLGQRVAGGRGGREEFWTVLTDPAGLAYCITDRDPATGELG